jgi:hypothetical protein
MEVAVLIIAAVSLPFIVAAGVLATLQLADRYRAPRTSRRQRRRRHPRRLDVRLTIRLR